MSTVLTPRNHLYRGTRKIQLSNDAYIRFDKQIEAMGPMAELVLTATMTLSGPIVKLLYLALLMSTRTVPMDLIPWTV